MPRGILTAGEEEDFNSLCLSLGIPLRKTYDSDGLYQQARHLWLAQLAAQNGPHHKQS